MTLCHQHCGWYVVRICPECNQQQGELSVTHTGDCPNLGKIFVMQELRAVPLCKCGERCWKVGGEAACTYPPDERA